MKELLFILIPESGLSLIVVFIGLALIIGILKRRAAFGLLGIVVLYALSMPFLESLFENLPSWLLLFLMCLFVASILSAVLRTIFGKGASDQFVGMLLFTFFMLPFRFIGYLFRGGRGRFLR